MACTLFVTEQFLTPDFLSKTQSAFIAKGEGQKMNTDKQK